jgi:predicted PurR-regulated permease PerM
MTRFQLYLLLATVLVVGVVLGWFFSEIASYLIISVVISSVLKPLVQTFTYLNIFGMRMPRALAVIMAFGLLFLFFGGFLLVIVPLVSNQMVVLSNLDYDSVLKSLEPAIKQAEKFLLRFNLVQEESGFLKRQLELKAFLGTKKINIPEIINTLVTFTTSAFIGFIAVLFISFFLLYERGILKRSILKFIPNRYFELSLGAMFKIEKVLTSYLLGLTVQILGIFTMTAFGLTFLNVPYALTIAFLAAIINVIPYIGPLIGGSFSIFIALTSLPSNSLPDAYLVMGIKVFVLTSIIHLIDNFFMQPLIFSKSVKAHPLEIFVAIFAGAAIAGVVGMIVAIPVYTVLRVVIKELRMGYDKYTIFRLQKR